MTNIARPTTMTWKCDGYTIRMDEDGVHANWNRTLEQPEVQQFVNLWTKVRDLYASDAAFHKPVPPPRRDTFGSGVDYAAKRAKAAAVAAIDAELGRDDPDEDPVF